MTFRLLGPIEVRRDGAVVRLNCSRMAKRLLAALLLEAPHFLTVAKLDDRVFGHTAIGNTRQRYVSQVRKDLTPDGSRLLQERDSSYRIDTPADSVDVTRF